VYDISSFYSDTLPLILVFYAAFYWRIYLCFLLFDSSVQQIFWHCPFLPSLHLAGQNCDTNTIDRYYRSCWLPIVSIHRLKIFHFWLIVSIIVSKKKIIFSIESNHRLKIFFSSKDHWSNWYFFTVNRLSVSIQSMFFSPSVPNYADLVTLSAR
jgi:hypothetical protein